MYQLHCFCCYSFQQGGWHEHKNHLKLLSWKSVVFEHQPAEWLLQLHRLVWHMSSRDLWWMPWKLRWRWVEDGVVGLGNRIFHNRVTFEIRNDESTKIRKMTIHLKRVANSDCFPNHHSYYSYISKVIIWDVWVQLGNDMFINYTHSKEKTSEGNDQFIKTIFFRLSKVVNQHTELEHSP